MNIFSDNSILGRFLNIIGDIVILHFLWLLCSIPLFTIGASTTALYYSCMKRIRTGEGYVTRNFFRAFKENFKQATLIWLILICIGLILFADLSIGLNMSGMLSKFILISCSVFLIPYALVLLYIFPVQAKFENKIRDNFKNALLMSLRHFGYSLILIVILATFVIIGLGSQIGMGLMLLCGAGFYGYLSSNVFVFIFRKYIPDELEADVEASGINQLR